MTCNVESLKHTAMGKQIKTCYSSPLAEALEVRFEQNIMSDNSFSVQGSRSESYGDVVTDAWE